jgi:hypothetical protein
MTIIVPDGKLLTVGQAALICRCAPRLVRQWIDTGALQGHRLPQSKHRRLTPEALRSFLVENGMPVPEGLDGTFSSEG